MNTAQLQNHLASSLSDLARICESHKKTDTTDAVVLRVLSDNRTDEEDLLSSIADVNHELRKIVCLEGYEPEVNFNQLYTLMDEESDTRNRLWHGLQGIASSVARESKKPNENILKFIYRALSSMNTEESSGMLREMDIVQKICSVSDC